MKLNFNTLVKWSAAIFGGAVLAACADLSDLENRVDDLESRVSALEAQIPALNESVSAINALFESYGNDARVIVNLQQVTENNETYYKFQLSGDETGTVYTLKQGQPGSAPEIDVRYNEETGKYEWWANYAGEGEEDDWQQIKVNGTEDPATTDAVVPQFRVNEKKNWEVSTDNGQNWTPVYYTGTQNPVPAVGSDSQWFEDIKYNSGTNILTVTMNGKAYEILALSDFSCVIMDADGKAVEYNFPVVFAAGETRNYTVAMTGVETARVIAPSGWTAELGDPDAAGKANFSITAPGAAAGTSASAAASAPQTKVSANSKTDITIHAINAKGLSIFAKMQVKAVEGGNPAMTVAAATSDQGYSRVKFDVSGLSNVSSFRCLLYAADEPAPTESMLASGQLVSEDLTDQLAFDYTADGASIEYGGEYALYVLPYNSDGESGSIITAEATTRIPATYSEVYNAGESITIAGKTYNSETYGAASVITSSNSEMTAIATGDKSGTAVYFVKPDAQAQFKITDGINTMLVIGDDMAAKSPVKVMNRLSLNQGVDKTGGTFICYNLDLDMTGFNNYHIYMTANGTYSYVGFIDCDFTLTRNALFGGFNTARKLNEVDFYRCRFDLSGLTDQTVLLSPSSIAASIGTISFRDNIVYSTDEAGKTDFRILLGATSKVDKVILKNNSFINTWHGTGSAVPSYIGCFSVGTVEVQYNILWTDKTFTNGYFDFFRVDNRNGGTYPTGDICDHNIAYCPNFTKDIFIFYSNNGFTGAEPFTKLTENPFEGGSFNLNEGIFKPNDTYTAYGSSIGR